MNILLILLFLLAVWRGWAGMKKGLIEEAGRLIFLVVSLFVVSVGILLYTSIRDGDQKNIILSVVVLLAAGLAVHLLKTLFRAMSALAHLPLLNLLNRLGGILIGVAEVVVALGIVYLVIGSFDTGRFGEMILQWTHENVWLEKWYQLIRIYRI